MAPSSDREHLSSIVPLILLGYAPLCAKSRKRRSACQPARSRAPADGLGDGAMLRKPFTKCHSSAPGILALRFTLVGRRFILGGSDGVSPTRCGPDQLGNALGAV